jgi:hypothetical protein
MVPFGDAVPEWDPAAVGDAVHGGEGTAGREVLYMGHFRRGLDGSNKKKVEEFIVELSRKFQRRK